MIYTTNAIESLNYRLRKVTRARGDFPNDEAAIKLLYLAICNLEKKWTMSPTLLEPSHSPVRDHVQRTTAGLTGSRLHRNQDRLIFLQQRTSNVPRPEPPDS